MPTKFTSDLKSTISFASISAVYSFSSSCTFDYATSNRSPFLSPPPSAGRCNLSTAHPHLSYLTWRCTINKLLGDTNLYCNSSTEIKKK